MRTLGIGMFALSLLAPAHAFADDKRLAKLTDQTKADGKAKPSDETKAPEAKAEPKPEPKPDAAPEAPPAKKTDIDSLLEDAVDKSYKKAEPVPQNKATAPAPTTVKPKVLPKPVVKPAEPTVEAPVSNTDDNDNAAEAAAPERLKAVAPSNVPRHRGPYELGKLDCRMLDGAGIERVLPGRIIAGEEPDILCRVIITQPSDVLSEEHSITLSVVVGERESFRQQRKVRMSSIGRRSLVFIVPSDKIATDDAAVVKFNASLSAPATPGGGRTVQFKVENED